DQRLRRSVPPRRHQRLDEGAVAAAHLLAAVVGGVPVPGVPGHGLEPEAVRGRLLRHGPVGAGGDRLPAAGRVLLGRRPVTWEEPVSVPSVRRWDPTRPDRIEGSWWLPVVLGVVLVGLGVWMLANLTKSVFVLALLIAATLFVAGIIEVLGLRGR